MNVLFRFLVSNHFVQYQQDVNVEQINAVFQLTEQKGQEPNSHCFPLPWNPIYPNKME